MKINSMSEKDTDRIAAEFANTLPDQAVILLHGTLGMGKSVFARSIIRTLMQRPDLDVPSPTFTLVQTYDTPIAPLYHFDLYRLEDPEELFNIGWEDALSDGIILVEWPERLGPYKPADSLDILIEAGDNSPHARTIHLP